MICSSGWSKSKLAKAAVRSHLVRWQMKSCAREAHFHAQNTPTSDHFGSCDVEKCTPLWREAHLEVKMYKTHHARTTIGSWDDEKVHTIVARSTFPNQNVQSTPAPDHFWKLRCRKSARCCGAKHIWKSTCTKHTMLGPLLEVEMSKKCRPFVARSAFPSQNVKSTTYHHMFGPRLGVQMSFRVAGARDCAPYYQWAKRCMVL